MAKQTVLIDTDRCVGCWTCAMVCHMAHHLEEDEYWLKIETVGNGPVDEPGGSYSDLTMSWKPVYTDKCTLCGDRQAKGLEPLCVRNCPTEALLIGNLEDPESAIARRCAELEGAGATKSAPRPQDCSRANVIYMDR